MPLDLSGNGILSGVDIAGSGLGKILQVVRATDTTLRSTTSDSLIDASIQVSITPSSTSSNILLIWTVAVEFGGSNQDKRFVGQITDTSNVAIDGTSNTYFGTFGSTSLNSFRYAWLIGYDSPASTSSQTYKGRYRVLNASTTCYLSND